MAQPKEQSTKVAMHETKDESDTKEEKENPEEMKQDASTSLGYIGLMADGDMDKITAEIEKQPLVSERQSLMALIQEFKEHNNYRRQIETLMVMKVHNHYRQMRRDGNCFYRAFLLGLFETIENNRDLKLLGRVSENVMTSLHRSLKFGYEQFTIEDFYYAFMDELQFYQRKIENGTDEYKASDGMGNNALQRMSNPGHAQYLIFWARMMASLHMRENEKDFAPFIQQNKGGFHQWLRSDVEALKSEADHLQTVALSNSIQVAVTIYCLENIDKGGPSIVNTIESEKSCFDILYRPGHYDVLYRNLANSKVVFKQQKQPSNNDNKNDQNDQNDKNNNNKNDNKNEKNQTKQTQPKKNDKLQSASNSNDNDTNNNETK